MIDAMSRTTSMRFNATGYVVAATGNHVQWTAVDVSRMENGKIAEEWAADDLTAILHDMGLYTPPWLS